MYERVSKELKELDTFDQIAQSLRQVAQLVSEDEYEDYNSQELYCSRDEACDGSGGQVAGQVTFFWVY